MPAYERTSGEWVEQVPHARSSAEWTDDEDSLFARVAGEWELIHPDPASVSSLLPVENLVVTSGPDDHSVTIGWTNPTQPYITPTDVEVRVAELGAVWGSFTYPITEYAWSALLPETTYVAQVRLKETDGIDVIYSPIKHVEFTTTAAPIGVPAPDPGGSGGDSLIPVGGGAGGGAGNPVGTVDGCWWEWKIQVLDPATLAWSDEGTTGTVSGLGDDISINLSTLDSTMVYRTCRRSACDTTSDGNADTWGTWGDCSQSFIGGTDWDLVCGGYPDSTEDPTGGIPSVAEVTDAFTRANEAPATTPWTQTDVAGIWGKHFDLVSNAIVHGNTTDNSIMLHNTALSSDSAYVQIDGMKYGCLINLRHDAVQPFYSGSYGYRAGRYYFGSGGTDWRWSIWREGVEVASASRGADDPAVATKIRFEIEQESGSADLVLYVDDVEKVTYTDASPLADGGYAGVWGDGRGGATPLFDNFEAGIINLANVYTDAVFAFPKICLDADADQVILTERVSGVQVGKGGDYLWAFNDGDWKVQADSDGGVTMLAPIAVLETLMLPGQDSSWSVQFAFDDGHVLSARSYPIATIGGLGLSFWITETVTGWTPSVLFQTENGPVELEGVEAALDTDSHVFVLRFDADGDKDFFVDGDEVDSDTSGDDWAAFTIQPFYVTAAKEYGINGQQVGWDRLLTDAEIESLSTLELVADSLWAHWDPESLVTTDVGDNVDYWDDLVAARRLDNPGGGVDTGTVTRNGRNVLDFKNRHMTLTGGFALGTDDVHMYMVVDTHDTSSVYYMGTYVTSPPDGVVGLFRTSALGIWSRDSSGTSKNAYITESGAQPWRIVHGKWDRSVGVELFIDDVSQASTASVDATDFSTARAFYVGRYFNNTTVYDLDGYVGDIVILKGANISASDHDAVISYLNRKWNL